MSENIVPMDVNEEKKDDNKKKRGRPIGSTKENKRQKQLKHLADARNNRFQKVSDSDNNENQLAIDNNSSIQLGRSVRTRKVRTDNKINVTNSRSSSIMVCVGSTNPVKISSSRNAISEIFPRADIVVEGYNVPSNVPDQPMGNNETEQGAKNRAMNAFNMYNEKYNKYPDYAIGLEGMCA